MRCRFAALLVMVFAAAAIAEDWPYYRGPQFNGVSAEPLNWPKNGAKVLWRNKVGVGASSFVTAHDRVVTMGNTADRDIVRCFEPATGKLLWTFEYPAKFASRDFEGGTAATPTIDPAGQKVYTLSYDGQLNCLDLDTGKRIWSVSLPRDFAGKPSHWDYACSPLVLGDLLIVDSGGAGQSTLALNKTTGAKVWASGDDKPGYASPVPVEQGATRGVMLLKSDALVAYDLADGHELWRIPWKADWSVNAASPVSVDGKVLLTAGYGSGRTALFDVSSGSPKKLWQNDELKSRIESLVVFGGRVYGVSEAKRGSLMCLDLTSGKTVWQQPGFGKFAGLMVAGGKLVVLSEDGQLVIANTGDKYEEIARQKVLGDRCWVMPVVSNGLIFCRNNVGDVAVVDVRPRK